MAWGERFCSNTTKTLVSDEVWLSRGNSENKLNSSAPRTFSQEHGVTQTRDRLDTCTARVPSHKAMGVG